ncbi:MAG: hypothetical protein NWP84_00560 [Cyanobium sp. MAG_04]|nr:hypothetical protein [Cyanobium sp. MAG_04]
MVVVGLEFDTRLARALQEGPEVLPADAEALTGYLDMIAGLLADHATERHESWSSAVESEKEIADLLALEEVVAERAVSLRAETVEAVLQKLRVWRRLDSGDGACDDEDGRATVRDRLVLSVEADLTRMARAAR